MERRKLAIYKESGKPWTAKQFNTALEYCLGRSLDDDDDEKETSLYPEEANAKYIFDDGAAKHWFYMWYNGDDEPPSYCTKVSYESLFKQPQLKTYTIKDFNDNK